MTAPRRFADVIDDATSKDNARVKAEADLKVARDDATKARKDADKLTDDAEKSKAAADAKAAAATPPGTRDSALDTKMKDDAAKATAAADTATKLEAVANKHQQDIKKIQDDAKKAMDDYNKLIATQRQRARLGDGYKRLEQKSDKWEPDDTPQQVGTPPSIGSLRGDKMIEDGTFSKKGTTMTIKDGITKYVKGDFATFMAGAMDKLIAQGSTKLSFTLEPPAEQHFTYSAVEAYLDKLEKRAGKYGVTGEFPPEVIAELRKDGDQPGGAYRDAKKGKAILARLDKINQEALIKKASLPDPDKASKELADVADKVKAKALPAVAAVTPPVIVAPATALTAADFKPKVDELEQKVQAIQARVKELEATKAALEKYYKECGKMDDEGLRNHRDEHHRDDSKRKDAMDLIDKEIKELGSHEAQFQKDRKALGDELDKVGVPLPATKDWQEQIDKLNEIQKAVDGLKNPLDQMKVAEIQKLRDVDKDITDRADVLAAKGPTI